MAGGVLLDSEVDRPHVQHDPGQDGISGCRRFSSTCCSSRSISWDWPACRGAYPDYAVQFTDWNMVSSIGGFGFGLSQILFVIVIVQCIRGGKKATREVWDGTRPHGPRVDFALAAAVSQLHHGARDPMSATEFARQGRVVETPHPQRRPGVGDLGAGVLFRLHRAAGLSQSPLMDPIDPKKRANRKLIRALLIMTAGSFAFGWALVPLYDVFCRAAGIGNAEAKAGRSVVAGSGRSQPRSHHRVRRRARLRGQFRFPARKSPRCGFIRESSTTPSSMPRI